MKKNENTVRVKVGSKVEVKTTSGWGHSCNPFLYYSGGRTIYVETGVQSLISELQRIQNEFKGEYTDLTIEAVNDCGCYGECRCGPSYYVYGYRPMNDVELQFTTEKSERNRLEREERERAELARLQQKYNG